MRGRPRGKYAPAGQQLQLQRPNQGRAGGVVEGVLTLPIEAAPPTVASRCVNASQADGLP